MKKILIVVDMQNDFVDGALGTREAEGIVDRVVSKIKEFDGEIIATLDTHGQDYLQTAEGKKLPFSIAPELKNLEYDKTCTNNIGVKSTGGGIWRKSRKT